MKAESEDCRALTVVETIDVDVPPEEGQADGAESGADPDCEIDEGGSWPLRMAIAIVITLVAVWLISCLHPFLRLVLESEPGSLGRAMAWSMLGVLLGLVLLCVAYVAWGYFHLPKIIRYSLKKYQGKEHKLASLLSQKYIRRIKYSRNAYAALAGEDAVNALEELRKSDVGKSSEWLNQFKTFQNALDKQAKREISNFSTRIGATTVISQMRATDMIAVVVLSAMMLLKLARIYNQRLSAMSALRLAIRWGANVYVAGEAQAFSRKLAKGVLHLAGGAVKVVGSLLATPAVGESAAKACDMASGAVGLGAEFAVNKILAKKLGTFARKQLHALDD